MSDWVWIKNAAVNDIPGRIPAAVLPDWEARGWEKCSAPTEEEESPVAPAPAVTPSPRGQSKEN